MAIGRGVYGVYTPFSPLDPWRVAHHSQLRPCQGPPPASCWLCPVLSSLAPCLSISAGFSFLWSSWTPRQSRISSNGR